MLQNEIKIDLDEKILEYENSRRREKYNEKKYRKVLEENSELTNKLLENEEDLEAIMEKYKKTVELVSQYQDTVEQMERLSAKCQPN